MNHRSILENMERMNQQLVQDGQAFARDAQEQSKRLQALTARLDRPHEAIKPLDLTALKQKLKK